MLIFSSENFSRFVPFALRSQYSGAFQDIDAAHALLFDLVAFDVRIPRKLDSQSTAKWTVGA